MKYSLNSVLIPKFFWNYKHSEINVFWVLKNFTMQTLETRSLGSQLKQSGFWHGCWRIVSEGDSFERHWSERRKRLFLNSRCTAVCGCCFESRASPWFAISKEGIISNCNESIGALWFNWFAVNVDPSQHLCDLKSREIQVYLYRIVCFLNAFCLPIGWRPLLPFENLFSPKPIFQELIEEIFKYASSRYLKLFLSALVKNFDERLCGWYTIVVERVD